MNRRPDLIAPVLIMAGALIVIGGIATGLSGTGETPAAHGSPLALQEKEVAVPPAATSTVTPTTTIANDTAGPKGAANATPIGTTLAPAVPGADRSP